MEIAVNCRRLAKAAACAFVAALLAQGAGAAAEPVATRAGMHEDFGRIVFDWPAEVGFETSVEDGTLRISFSRPLETDLGAVETYIQMPLIAPCGEIRNVESAA